MLLATLLLDRQRIFPERLDVNIHHRLSLNAEAVDDAGRLLPSSYRVLRRLEHRWALCPCSDFRQILGNPFSQYTSGLRLFLFLFLLNRAMHIPATLYTLRYTTQSLPLPVTGNIAINAPITLATMMDITYLSTYPFAFLPFPCRDSYSSPRLRFKTSTPMCWLPPLPLSFP